MSEEDFSPRKQITASNYKKQIDTAISPLYYYYRGEGGGR
jgi:hypothetical protein